MNPTGATRKSRFRVLATILGVITLDQISKLWAVAMLSGKPISVVGTVVEFTLVRNSQSAFGLWQGSTAPLTVITALVAVFLVWVLRSATDRWSITAYSLILGGALGNMIDRVTRAPGGISGAVIDFMKVGWWPVFNIADSAITIGATLAILRSLRHVEPSSDE